VVETPEWQFGGRAQLSFDPVSVGVQAKHTGDRFVTDVNDIVSKGYTVVDLDARLSLAFAGMTRTYLQLNVSNLLNEKYFGNLTTAGAFNSGTPRFTFGAPRTVIGSIRFEF
jgi:iron complex outermembrane recepter protein